MVESVGQQDVDLYKRIQIAPLVDFDSLAEVIVLEEIPRAAKPAAKTPQNAKPQKNTQNGKKTRP